jgi:hypothetical protein
MNIAYASLAALVVAILVSCFTELNVGILALALAWVVGVYLGGMSLNDVIGGFPVSLFLTLSGVTLLFAQAQSNRTLDRIAHRAVRLCRGNAGLIQSCSSSWDARSHRSAPGISRPQRCWARWRWRLPDVRRFRHS